MNVDPSSNRVIFVVDRNGHSESHSGRDMTQASDCIKNVWLNMQQKYELRPQDVCEVYSQWEPSPQDIRFMNDHFPANLRVSYSFERPTDGCWEPALEDVRQYLMSFAPQPK